MDETTRRDRCRGAMVGTAIGDALGAPFEGRHHPPPSAIDAWSTSTDLLRWTDDTHMTMGVAASLAAVGGLDCDEMAARFVENYEAEPWRGYGAGPPQVFAAMRRGMSWREAAANLFGGSGSYGNGAAMRSAPFGLYSWRDPDQAAHLAHRAAAITHTHEIGRQGAAVMAYTCARMVTTGNDEAAGGAVDETADETAELVAALADVAHDPAFRERLDALSRLGPDTTPAVAAAELGNGIAAADSVPAALHAALHHPHSFADAVLHAVAIGGDSDTIAAMAGAASGARLGLSAIPTRWVDRIEQADELVELADQLAAVS